MSGVRWTTKCAKTKTVIVTIVQSNSKQLNLSLINKKQMLLITFSTIVSIATTLPPLSLEEGNSLVLYPTACLQELYCSEQWVYELLTNLDHKKISGPDGISATMLKETTVSIAPVL